MSAGRGAAISEPRSGRLSPTHVGPSRGTRSWSHLVTTAVPRRLPRVPECHPKTCQPSEGDLFVPKHSGRGPVLRVLAGRRRSVRPWLFAELWARTARVSRSWSLTGRVLSPRRASHPLDLATPDRAAAREQPSAQPLADLVELGTRGVMY